MKAKFQLNFSIEALLNASRETQIRFNTDSMAWQEGAFSEFGDNPNTINGLMIEVRRSDDGEDTDDGIWDASVMVNLEGNFLSVQGGDRPGGGAKPIEVHINRFGEIIHSTAPWPVKFHSLYTEPTTDNAAERIEADFNGIVSREYW